MRTFNTLFSMQILARVAVLSVLAAPGGRAQEEPVVLDEIVARVNNEIITLSDLNSELRLLRQGLEQEIQDPQALEQEYERQKPNLLRTLIQNKILLQRAEELGFSANMEAQVSSVIEELRKEAGIPNNQVLDQVLRQRGSSLDEYRRNLRQKLIIDGLLQQFVYSKITLLTPEIEAYYKENIARFTEPSEVELKEILFLTEDKVKSNVRERAEEILAKLRSGASFEDLAKQYSEGPTASRGGEIGAFKKGQMSAAIENVAFELDEGQVSEIIEADYGFQIVKVVSKKEPRQKPLEEVRNVITSEIYQQKAKPQMEDFFEDLRDQSYIYVAPKYQEEFDVKDLVTRTE